MPIDSNRKYISRSIITIYNACYLKLNTVLADNGLDGFAAYSMTGPVQKYIPDNPNVLDRTLGVYCLGGGVYQNGFEDNEPPMVQITIDALLRDSDSEGTKQYINRYADVIREFLEGIDIGMIHIVSAMDMTRKDDDKRNRLAFLFVVKFNPMTDLDRQGLDLDVIL
jgi:hypothetical protein